jgi:hypothetical protein
MAQNTQEIAARCLEDPEFAQQIIDGDEHEEVRSAILSDLEEAADVTGFIIIDGCKIGAEWITLARPNLKTLIGYSTGGP